MSRYIVREQCRNCKHHLFDPQEGKCVCVNPESDEYTGYTEHTDTCEKWELKTINRI